MLALITGASSGIGREFAYQLANDGYDLILASRNIEELNKIKSVLKTDVMVIKTDLNKQEDVYSLYNEVKDKKIDLIINNAGFGLFGYFYETDLDRELEMINVNVIAPHILTKLFLKDFINKNNGKILNVCSSAGFLTGPYLSTYYATKNYLTKLSMAINYELRENNINVLVSSLCPGPVKTNFNKNASGSFKVSGLESKDVVKYALKQLKKNKDVIVPGLSMKLGLFFSKFVPRKTLMGIVLKLQKNKEK